MMNREQEKAAYLLEKENATCVFVKGDSSVILHERGIKPLILLIEEGADLDGYAAADRVVGKAAAFLHIMLGVKTVYARTVSRPALEVFASGGVAVCYDNLADRIINRDGTGLCPMEAAVMDIDNMEEAYDVLKVITRA